MTAALPTEDLDFWLTDSGLETDLIFHHGVELPCFASFVLLETEAGTALLRRYFMEHAEVAATSGVGIVLESPTWRASEDWGRELGYDAARLASVNEKAVRLLHEVRTDVGGGRPLVISGCIGPRGDGYRADDRPTVQAATDYHRAQVDALAAAGADLVSALTLTYVEEAIAVATAASEAGIPVVLSFTVGTTGDLIDGSRLGAAILAVDEQTDRYPAYYMVNCAHPDHVAGGADGGPWTERLLGVRANASRMSHAELDESETLDDGDPDELAAGLLDLTRSFPALRVFGGCCGTDLRHIAATGRALAR